MNVDRYLEAYIHREVEFRYKRQDLSFGLSQELFSSAAVDAGTRLLLRLVKEAVEGLASSPGSREPEAPHGSVNGTAPVFSLSGRALLDVGCGAGTLGISLAKASGAALIASDRDALAVWFTRRNAERNSLHDVVAECALDVSFAGSGAFSGVGLDAHAVELAVSNLPAKAGEPVLRRMIRSLPQAARTGTAAVVIVLPLAELLKQEVRAMGGSVLAERRTTQHLAVLYRRTPSQPECGQREMLGDDRHGLPAWYVRGRHEFAGPRGRYEMTTVYNIPEFDSLSYDTEIGFRMMKSWHPAGRLLYWGVGQGHLVVSAARNRSAEAPVFVADRDLLAVRATTENLRRSAPETSGVPLVLPTLAPGTQHVAPSSLDWLIVRGSPASRSLWDEEVVDTAETLLAPGGRALIVTRSSALARLERRLRASFSVEDSSRSRGYRVDVLRRKR